MHFLKNKNKFDIDAVYEKGLRAGLSRQDARNNADKQAKNFTAGQLKACYNAASSLIKALDTLKERSNGAFKYEIEEYSPGYLNIDTNIPVRSSPGRKHDYLNIVIDPNGDIDAAGDQKRDSNASIITHGAAAIYELVVKKALLAGFIKKTPTL